MLVLQRRSDVRTRFFATRVQGMRAPNRSSRRESLGELWASRTTKAAEEPVVSVAIDREASEALAEFKRGVEKAIGSDNGEAHLNLAQAYAEMGLYEDARREAGTAILAGAVRSFVQPALRILLTEPLLSSDGRQRLRELLRQKLN